MNGELFDAYCQRRWGGSQWTQHLRHEGAKDGCHFANWKYICNTLRAHQLILYGTKYHPSRVTTDTMNTALFEALYEDGLNISLVDTLVDIGTKLFGGTGTDSDGTTTSSSFRVEHLRRYLEEQQGRRDVELEIEQLQRQYRIRGVPSFHVGIVEATAATTNDATNDDPHHWTSPPHSFSGAQSAGVFVELFEELSLEM